MKGWTILLLGLACSSSNGNANAPTARFNLSGDTPPSLMEVPFPSDVYRVNGSIVDPLPGVDALVPRNAQAVTHELGKLDGFGRGEAAFFYVDDPSQPLDDNGQLVSAAIDPASLPASEDACVADTSSVFLLDVATGARVPCRAAFHDDSQTSSAHQVVAVGPALGVLLDEGHAYAAVLTSRVRDLSGAHVVASPDFQALLGGQRSGAIATMYGAAIDAAESALAPALATDQTTIVAIAPFTTNTATRELFTLRESLDAMPTPTLAWDANTMAPMGAVKFAALVADALPAGFTASLDDWLGVAPQKDGADDPDWLVTHVLPHDQVAAIGTAVYASPNFLVTKPNGYSDLDDQTFARDASNAIVPNPAAPTMPVWVSFAIPKAPMPASGYPCVIVAHGNPGSRAEAFLQLANRFAKEGFVVAGIDLVTDGARSLDAKYRVDAHTDWESSPGATYVGPDGFADDVDQTPPPTSGRDSGLNFLGQGVNFGAIRDQTRESMIDVSVLVRVLASDPDLSPLQTGGTAPKIDPTKIVYFGGSQGAITGAGVAAIEPNVATWVLNVGGGEFVLNSSGAGGTEANVQKQLVLAFGVTGQYVDWSNPLAAIAQTVLDPGDPLAYAPYLLKSPGTIHGTKIPPRNILQIEALYDETISNDASEALARAGGWGLASPNVGSNADVTTLDEVRDPSKVPYPTLLPTVTPDGSSLIHDTPVQGTTAVLVQVTGQHYRNVLQSSDLRAYPVPFNRSTAALATPYSVAQSFVAQQDMIASFLTSSLTGVPALGPVVAPVRDVDEDGNPDATDPDPNDPTVK